MKRKFVFLKFQILDELGHPIDLRTNDGLPIHHAKTNICMVNGQYKKLSR